MSMVDHMKYKLAPIEIPAEDPFRFDVLNRRPSVEALSRLVDELQGPFVLAIDSPWGTGKTTFVQFLMSVLKSKGYPCLYFNAWETDFSIDPMVAFLGELGTLVSKDVKNESAFARHFQKAKKIATLLAKKAIPVVGKVATGGILDLDSFTEKSIAEYVAISITDAVDAYVAERALIEEFRASLGDAIKKLSKDGKKSEIIIFVDELDRCRPTYAIELLERIKHLFNIDNVIFVLSLDKEQLHTSLGAVYGKDIHSDEYLRRFIDLEYLLPRPNAESFTNSLFSRFEFDKFFEKRTHSDLHYEKENLIKAFVALSEIFILSLRAREQCFTRIRVAMMATPENHYLFPHLLTILTVLRVGAPTAYRQYALEGGSAKELVEHLKTLKGGIEMLDSHFGAVTEAYLIAARSHWRDKSSEVQEYEAISNDASRPAVERERAGMIVKIVSDMSFRNSNPSLSYVVNKLELAAQFKQ